MIQFVVALECEARPLVNSLGLVRENSGGTFKVYSGNDCRLVVSGPGYALAAAATAYAGSIQAGGPFQAGWLNIGVAGHPVFEMGRPILADKVIDGISGQNWYPQLLFDWDGDTGPVRTVAAPESQFDVGACHDMEAAAFFTVANRFSTIELIHCLKIVSDNGLTSSDRLRPSMVTELVTDALPQIKLLVGVVEQLVHDKRGQDEIPDLWEPLLEKWHFSETQGLQLRELVRHYMMRPGRRKTLEELESGFVDGGELLRYLRELEIEKPINPM